MAMTLRQREIEQAQRNQRPHAEARLAMAIWSREYAHQQKGGSMDFWDAIGDRRRKLCREIVEDVLKAHAEFGRAPNPSAEER